MEGLLIYAGFFALGCLVTFLVMSFLGEGEPEDGGEGVWEITIGEDGEVTYSWKDYLVFRVPNPTVLNRIANFAEMEKPVDRFIWVGTEHDIEIARDEELIVALQTCETLETMKKHGEPE